MPTETAAQPKPKAEFVGFNPTLPDPLIPSGAATKVQIVSWDSPFKFNVQLKSVEESCDEMMHQLQQFYNRNASAVTKKLAVGSFVVARHKSDQTFKRGKIVDYNAARNKYKIQSIDYGGTAVYQPGEIFELEKSFIRLAPLAICCTLKDILLQKSPLEIQQKIDSYFSDKNAGVECECEFGTLKNDQAVVEITINGENLKELMIRDQLIVNLPKGMSTET